MLCHDQCCFSVRGIASLVDLSTLEEISIISVTIVVEKGSKVARQVMCFAKWCVSLSGVGC